MSVLGGGLSEARHHEDALSVYEAELAMERRLGASEKTLFAVQTNLALRFFDVVGDSQSMAPPLASSIVSRAVRSA